MRAIILKMRAILPLLAGLLLARAPLGAQELPADPEFPPTLQPLVAALLHAGPPGKDDACDRLLADYVPLLKSGTDIPPVDTAIADSVSVESRTSISALLAIEGSFTGLQEACLARNRAEGLTGLQAERASSADGLFHALKLLSDGHPADRAGWARVAAGLHDGWRFFPSELYAGKLEAALKACGDRRGLFEFKAYRYFDESGPNPLRSTGLFLRWLTLFDKRGFGEEIAAVKREIKADILRTSPSVSALPDFGGDVFLTAQGVPHQLSFRLPESELYGKRVVFAFFETTCGYCFDELSAIGRILPVYHKRAPSSLAVVGLKLPTPLPPALSALSPFEKRLSVPYPLLENDASEIRGAYNVHGVPLLLFLDDRGVPLWTVALRGQGRIGEKLSWFFDDLLADVPAAHAASVASPARRLDVYADPSSAECVRFMKEQVPALEEQLGVLVEVALHDSTIPCVTAALADRCIALRLLPVSPPVAILDRRVIQGFAAMTNELAQVPSEHHTAGR
jgi:hypothetical protein